MTETTYIDTPQGRIPVHVTGAGAPVVFIHGALVDHRLWEPVVERMPGIRAIRPVLPLGSHTTAAPADADLTPPALAGMIRGVLDALELDDVTLVGNDTGGALCQIAMAASTDRVGRLVLTNCDAYDQFLPTPFKPLQAIGYVPGAPYAVGKLMKADFLRRGPLGYGLLTVRPIDGALLDSWLEPVASDAGVRRDLAKLLRGISKRYTLDAIEKLKVAGLDTTIVWGKRDRAFKPKLAERLAADIPGARLEWVEDSSTFVSLDRPDALAEVLGTVVPAPEAVR